MIARAKAHADANGLAEKVAGPIDGVVCYLVTDARRWWPTDVPDESK